MAETGAGGATREPLHRVVAGAMIALGNRLLPQSYSGLAPGFSVARTDAAGASEDTGGIQAKPGHQAHEDPLARAELSQRNVAPVFEEPNLDLSRFRIHQPVLADPVTFVVTKLRFGVVLAIRFRARSPS